MESHTELHILIEVLESLAPHWNRAKPLIVLAQSGGVSPDQARALLGVLSETLHEEHSRQYHERSLSIREGIAQMENSEKKDFARTVDIHFPF